jgi:CheY-like chemotaxis protein
MPNMSGNEMARRLLARRPGLRILYMTGYSEESIFEFGVPAQTTPVLKKPFLADALDRKVREALEAHPGGER